MSSPGPLITPAMRVGELLDAYPQLEDVLADLAPPFKKLRNPVLRRTVAKVTTLQRAAAVAGIPVGQLIRTLREAVGQEMPDVPESADSEPASPLSADLPQWAAGASVVETIDADAMLEQGEHPINRVQTLLGQLQPGQIIRLTASFRPDPLIHMLQQKAYRVHVAPLAGEKLQVLIGRA